MNLLGLLTALLGIISISSAYGIAGVDPSGLGTKYSWNSTTGNLTIFAGQTVTFTNGTIIDAKTADILGVLDGNGAASGGVGADISIKANAVNITGGITAIGGTGYTSDPRCFCNVPGGPGGKGGNIQITAGNASISGNMTANGGIGGSVLTGTGPSGNGGQGGTISFIAYNIEQAGRIKLNGGTYGGCNPNNGACGSAGASGSVSVSAKTWIDPASISSFIDVSGNPTVKKYPYLEITSYAMQNNNISLALSWSNGFYATPTPINKTAANATIETSDATNQTVIANDNIANGQTSYNFTALAGKNYSIQVKTYETTLGASPWQYPVQIAAIIPDTTPPSISISSPSNTSYPSASVPVDFVVSDNTAVSACTVYLNGTFNSSSCSGGYALSLGNGAYTLNITANDTFGNANSSTVSFTISVPVYASTITDPNGIGNASLTDIPPAASRIVYSIGSSSFSKPFSASSGVSSVSILARASLQGTPIPGRTLDFEVA